MLNFLKLIDLLKNHSTFIISTHVNPDADAIGSVMAMAAILKQLSKEFYIINTSETPYNIQFLDKDNIIKVYNEDDHESLFEKADAAIVLDLSSLNRTVRMEKSFRKFRGNIICIDHHTFPEKFTENLFVDESLSSTGEILYDLIDSTDELKLNDDIALALILCNYD